MLVRFEVDGISVTGELLTSPNAIGVCQVGRLGVKLQRHRSRLSPEDDEARARLAAGDRFVTRDGENAIERAAQGERKENLFDGWTTNDVDKLREYVISRLNEVQSGRRIGRRAREYKRLHDAVVLINAWIKQSHVRASTAAAGLTEEQMRDPVALLVSAGSMLRRLSTRIYELSGENKGDDVSALCCAIQNYIVQHAPPIDLKAVK
jgi:hypothetical protein